MPQVESLHRETLFGLAVVVHVFTCAFEASLV